MSACLPSEQLPFDEKKSEIDKKIFEIEKNNPRFESLYYKIFFMRSKFRKISGLSRVDILEKRENLFNRKPKEIEPFSIILGFLDESYANFYKKKMLSLKIPAKINIIINENFIIIEGPLGSKKKKKSRIFLI